MARSSVQTITLAPASATNIRTAASISGAGSVTLNGSLVSGGVATLDYQRRILFTSAGNDSGITFTVIGTTESGRSINEVVTGAAIGTATTTLDFKTVTSIIASGASAGNVSIGTSGVAGSLPVVLNTNSLGTTAIQCEVVTGTVNFTVQSTLDDVFDDSSPTWVTTSDTAASGASTTIQTNYAYTPAAVRVLINSGTGTLKFTVLQNGI